MIYAKFIIALVCLVTFAGQPAAAANRVAGNWTTNGEIDIRDRLDTQQKFMNDYQILFRPDITNVELFTAAVDRRHDPGNNRQNDQSQHVIHNRRPQDDPRLLRIHLPQVF